METVKFWLLLVAKGGQLSVKDKRIWLCCTTARLLDQLQSVLGATAIGGTDLFSFLYPSAPTDYLGGSLYVSVPAGAVEVTLPVTTLLDNLVENNEHFKATLSLPDGPGYVVVGSLYVVFVTINDTNGMLTSIFWGCMHACSSIPVQFSTGL